MSTLITILTIITIATSQPVTDIEVTDTGTLITYINSTGYYQDFTD